MGIAHRDAAAVGRAVPPRVDLHRARAPAARELPRPHGRRAAARRTAAPARVRRPARHAPARRRRAAISSCVVERVDRLYDTEQAFVGLFGDEPHAFWLDSSRVGDERSRFSFMGAAGGPLGAVRHATTSERARSSCSRDGSTEVHGGSDLRLPRRELRAGAAPRPATCRSTSTAASSATSATSSRPTATGDARAPARRSRTRRSCFADRLIAFDHLERATYVLVCVDADRDEAEARALGRASSAAARRAAAAGPARSARRRPRRARRAPPQPRVRELPRRHPALPRVPRGGRELRGLPDEPDLGRRRARSARLLPDPAPHQPGAVLGLPALRRRRRAQLLARAVPEESTATAGSRPSRSRARPAAAATRRRTAALARGRCARARRTAPRT